MRKSKVLTKALAAILCIAMLIPMAVTVGAAETGSEPQATISVSTKRLSMTDQREVALSFNLGYKARGGQPGVVLRRPALQPVAELGGGRRRAGVHREGPDHCR